MKFEVKRIVRPIPLRDYAEEYGDEAIWVWVNPPRAKRLELYELGDAFGTLRDRISEAVDEDQHRPESDGAGLEREVTRVTDAFHAWWALMWSQHGDAETHWTAEEVSALAETCQDTDPALWSFLQDESFRLMEAHREGVKKKPNSRS